MTSSLLDSSFLLALGSVSEFEVEAKVVVSRSREVEVIEFDEVTCLPRVLIFDVLLHLSFSIVFSCRFLSLSAAFLSLS